MGKTIRNANSPLCAADFRRMAREALKGKWKKGSSFFLLSNLLFNGLGLHLVQKHFFTDDAVPSPVMEAFGLVPNGQMIDGFGWVLAGVLLIWSLVNGFLHVGMYRTCVCALDGGELRLKDLLPAKLFGRAALMGGMRSILLTIPELLAGLCLILFTVVNTNLSLLNLLSTLLKLTVGLLAAFLGAGLKMADYLMAKDEPIGPVAALKASWRKMRGWKWRYFCLGISFIGWLLLAVLPGNLFMRWVSIGNAFLKDLLVWLINLAASSGVMLYMTAATAAFFRHVETMEMQKI